MKQMNLFEKLKSKVEPTYATAKEFLDQELIGCTNCPLFALRKTDRSPVPSKGNNQAKVVVIGEGPGADEEALGAPFVGKSGKLLHRLLLQYKINTTNIYFTNIVKCRPPNNRTPNKQEIEACKRFIDKELELINPELVICVGATAANTILNKKLFMTTEAGTLHNVPNKYQVLVMYHPAACLYEEYKPNKPATVSIHKTLKQYGDKIRKLTKTIDEPRSNNERRKSSI